MRPGGDKTMAKRAATAISTSGNRARWTAEEAASVLDAWRASGEPVRAYARRVGVDPQRLFYWRRRLCSVTSARPASSAGSLVPVVVRAAEPITIETRGEAALIVSTRGELRIEVRDVDTATAAWVASLVGALDAVRA